MFFRQSRIWSFHVVALQRTAKKCTKSYNARAQLLLYSLNLLFSDVAVAVVVFLGPVHTNPFSNENGALLLRIRLSSTLQRRKRSPKTEPFENALQSGAIWKRCFLKTLFPSVDGENDTIWKRWRDQNHSTVSTQSGGQALPCGFNFAPISRADIFKCSCVEFIWPCALRV